MVMEAVIG